MTTLPDTPIIDHLSTNSNTHTLALIVKAKQRHAELSRNKINVEQVIVRRSKGYAFLSYPTQFAATAQEYRAKIAKEITEDYLKLRLSEFIAKYADYIY